MKVENTKEEHTGIRATFHTTRYSSQELNPTHNLYFLNQRLSHPSSDVEKSEGGDTMILMT